jgi:hypothetical protein
VAALKRWELGARITSFERRLSDLRSEIEKLPSTVARRDLLKTFAEVSSALAKLKSTHVGIKRKERSKP